MNVLSFNLPVLVVVSTIDGNLKENNSSGNNLSKSQSSISFRGTRVESPEMKEQDWKRKTRRRKETRE